MSQTRKARSFKVPVLTGRYADVRVSTIPFSPKVDWQFDRGFSFAQVPFLLAVWVVRGLAQHPMRRTV